MHKLRLIFETLVKSYEQYGIEYAVCGNYEELPDYTDNDIDIWVNEIVLGQKLLLDAAKLVGLRLYMKNVTANGVNNYFYSNEDCNFEIIKIDIMRETAYRSCISIVPSNIIRNNRDNYKFFNVVNKDLEAVMHLLYPLIAYGVVKEKYKNKFTLISNSKKFENLLEQVIGSELSRQLISCMSNSQWDELVRFRYELRKYLVVKTFASIDLERLFIFTRFVRSVIGRIVTRNGLIIAFTGIDGAGKTTIKNLLVKNGDKYFAKSRTKEFYWRPFLLPKVADFIRVKGQGEVISETGRRVVSVNTVTKLKSLVKYAYYVSDFILGQAKYFTALHTGGLVVFDRYHFDNIVYPERFGFRVNKKLMRTCDRWLIPKPDILFYFTAEAITLYERKKEIDVFEIKLQQEQYENELKHLDYSKIIYTDEDIESTELKVLLMCMNKMAGAYEKGDE